MGMTIGSFSPPFFSVCPSIVDDEHVLSRVPPVALNTTVVSGSVVAETLVFAGYTLTSGHGIAFSLHSTVAEAEPAPSKATKAIAAAAAMASIFTYFM